MHVSAHALRTGGAWWQIGAGIPAHAEAQRERIADDDARAMGAEGRDAVCGCGEDVCIFSGKVRRSVEEDVEAGGDVEMRFLESSG